jgi:hypothetical protein
MKYIIFTFEGNAFPIAKRLLDEGCEVVVGQVGDIAKTLTRLEKIADNLEDPEEKHLRLLRYSNIIPRIDADSLVAELLTVKHPEDYFIFFDSNNLFYYADKLRHLHFHGNFPTEEDRLFEVDRNMAKDFVKRYYPGLKISEKKDFRLVKDAKLFLKNSHQVWVLKSQTDALQAFVPDTNDPSIARMQILENLETFSDGYESAGFFLEVKIPSIMEYTPEKLYYDGVPLAVTMNLENKSIGSGNISFQVGCAGDLVFPISMESKIHDLAFPPIVDEIAKKHKGFFIWDASILFDRQTGDAYFGEFCPNRPGYNSFFTELAQTPSVHSFFEKIVDKRDPFTVGSVAVSLMLFNLLRDPKGTGFLPDSSIIYPESIEQHIWPYDIYKKKKNDFIRTVGYDLHLSPVTSSGKTLLEAIDSLYAVVDSFKMSGLYYRPKFDFVSREYPTSIMNRLDYALAHDLFDLPFQSF